MSIIVMLTVDNLSLLKMLLQELNTAINTALHLLVGADLHGNIVSEKNVSHVRLTCLQYGTVDVMNQTHCATATSSARLRSSPDTTIGMSLETIPVLLTTDL
jgi:hypothetical protein